MGFTFITGPVRSGKSRFAALLAVKSGLPVTYVATAGRGDDDPEWRERIERHRSERPASWKTVETFSDTPLVSVIENAQAGELLLVDSLGTWLAQQLFSLSGPKEPRDTDTAVTQLISALSNTAEQIILVSEETGWGVVPAHQSGRVFRDELGRANAILAERAQLAYLVICGHVFNLKIGVPIGSWL